MRLTKQKNLLDLIVDFFFPVIKKEKICGSLTVSNSGKSEFNFKKKFKHATVYFDDECHHIPCNPSDPNKEDHLQWKIIKYHNRRILIIEWNVECIRTIIWEIC